MPRIIAPTAMHSIGVVGDASSGCTQKSNLRVRPFILRWIRRFATSQAWRASRGILAMGDGRTRRRLRRCCLAWSGKTGFVGIDFPSWRASQGILATGNDHSRTSMAQFGCKKAEPFKRKFPRPRNPAKCLPIAYPMSQPLDMIFRVVNLIEIIGGPGEIELTTSAFGGQRSFGLLVVAAEPSD